MTTYYSTEAKANAKLLTTGKNSKDEKLNAINNPNANAGSTIGNLNIVRRGAVGSGDLGVIVTWTCGTEDYKIDHFEVDVEYLYSSVGFYNESGNSTNSISGTSHTQSGVYTYEFSADSSTDLSNIAVRVRPIPGTHQSNVTYWIAQQVTVNKKKKYKLVKTTTLETVVWFTYQQFTGYVYLNTAPALQDSQDAAEKLKTAIPDKPGKPSAALESNGSITVTFDAAIDETAAGNSRNLYRCVDGNYTVAGLQLVKEHITGNGTGMYVDSGVRRGQQVRYLLRAVNDRVGTGKPDEDRTDQNIATYLSDPVNTAPSGIGDVYADGYGEDGVKVSFKYGEYITETLKYYRVDENGRHTTYKQVSRLVGAYYQALESVKVYYSKDKETLKTNRENCDSASVSVSSSNMSVIISGLDTGYTYYFAVWMSSGSETYQQAYFFDDDKIASCSIASVPEAPTLGSVPRAASIGDSVELEWTHNDEDGSAQTAAQVVVTRTPYGGSASSTTYDVSPGTDEHYTLEFPSSSYADQDNVKVKVRTKGAGSSYGPYSEDVQLTIYAKPVITANIQDTTQAGPYGCQVSALPINVDLSVGAASGTLTQNVVRWHAYITALASSVYTDTHGNEAMLSAGETVYDAALDYYQDGFSQPTSTLTVAANEAVFVNGMGYKLTVEALMDSGIEAQRHEESFSCSLGGGMATPTARIVPQYDWSVRIFPEVDEEDALLTVYRINDDGTMSLIAEDLPNETGIFATDRHPSFGSMTYRIVANDQSTDEVTVVDISDSNPWDGMLIQWAEQDDDVSMGNGLDDVQFAFEFVRLPWNITISEQSSKDVAYKNYQGRKHPVVLYGTQVGESGSWSCEIVKYEEDWELQQLRKLKEWMGECWVRDASGLSYPANVDVSISRRYDSKAISVQLEVTRVDED